MTVGTDNGQKMSLVDKIIRFCLENKLIVALVVLFIIGWGYMVAPFDWEGGPLPRDPVAVDAIPDIGENQQIVFTKWPGRSPQDVEDQISYPLTSALLGVPGVKTIRSQSMFGFSSIYIIFDEDVEFYWSRSRILEKLNSLPQGTLPEGVQPALGPDSTALGQIFWYTLEGRDPEGNPPAAGIWTNCGRYRTGTSAMRCSAPKASARLLQSADLFASIRSTWIRMPCGLTMLASAIFSWLLKIPMLMLVPAPSKLTKSNMSFEVSAF